MRRRKHEQLQLAASVTAGNAESKSLLARRERRCTLFDPGNGEGIDFGPPSLGNIGRITIEIVEPVKVGLHTPTPVRPPGKSQAIGEGSGQIPIGSHLRVRNNDRPIR